MVKADWKRWNFRCHLKVDMVLIERMCAGKEFQVEGAQTQKRPKRKMVFCEWASAIKSIKWLAFIKNIDVRLDLLLLWFANVRLLGFVYVIVACEWCICRWRVCLQTKASSTASSLRTSSRTVTNTNGSREFILKKPGMYNIYLFMPSILTVFVWKCFCVTLCLLHRLQ